MTALLLAAAIVAFMLFTRATWIAVAEFITLMRTGVNRERDSEVLLLLAIGFLLMLALDTTPAHSAPLASGAPGDTMISFSMPRYHARPGLALSDSGNPIAQGYHRWELAMSTQAKACRDSGLAWCRDPRNFATWIPQAAIGPVLAYGYERPGYRVTVRRPRVMSLALPASWWVRTYTDTASAWQLVGTWGGNE